MGQHRLGYFLEIVPVEHVIFSGEKARKKRQVRLAIRRNARGSPAEIGSAPANGGGRLAHFAESPARGIQRTINGVASGPLTRAEASDEAAAATASTTPPAHAKIRPAKSPAEH